MNTQASVSSGDQGRVVATDLLQHTLWLLEQHESRNEAAQKAAVTVLTTTGAVAALVPKTLPGTATGLAGALLVIVGLAAVATFAACVKVLKPRRRQQGLPSVAALQRFVATLDAGQPVPMPQMQVLVDLLNSKQVGNLRPSVTPPQTPKIG